MSSFFPSVKPGSGLFSWTFHKTSIRPDLLQYSCPIDGRGAREEGAFVLREGRKSVILNKGYSGIAMFQRDKRTAENHYS
jgi:hypothetical protein